MKRVLFFALGLSAASCARCSTVSPGSDASPSASASASARPSDARCTMLGKPSVFGGGKDDALDAMNGEGAPLPFGAEIGGAASDASGFYVGIRSSGLLGPANVVRIPLDSGAITVLSTFVPTQGTARAPLVATDDAGGRYVGALSVLEKKHSFRVSRIENDGALKTLAEIEQDEDESEANAMIATTTHVAISWDDADPKHEHGRIHLVAIPKDGLPKTEEKKNEKDTAADVRSAETSDTSWPVLVRAPDGKRGVLLWLSERPEKIEVVDKAMKIDPDSAAGEPSQAEAFRWVEGAVVDLATGASLGPTRVLSATDGHAQTFAASLGPSGLVLAIRDDRRPTDGDGGELVVVRATVEATAIGEPTRSTLVKDDVAPGTPALVARPVGAFVAYLGLTGEAFLVPAFSPGATSREPALRGRRIVAVRDDRVLASRILGSGLELVVARCSQ